MQPSLEELEEKLTEEENEGILKARELQGQIEAQKKYQAESIRMNLDPYAVNEVVFQYYVDTEYVINLDEEIQSDYGDELVWAYTAYVEKNVLQSLLKEKLNWDMDAAYIGELLHAEPANMGNQFTLTVVGVDADQAEELAEQAADVLETYQSTLTDKIGSHKLILLDRSTAVVHDTALADEQTKLDESISAWQTKLDTLTAAFSPAQLQVYEWEDEEEAEAGAVAEATGFSIKYPILGVFAGAFLACVWVALRFILDGKMKNIRELEELYGLCILGELPLENGKKRFLSGIDKRLASLRSKGKQNPEKCREMLLTNLLLACRRENVKELLVTTSQELSDSDCRLLED